MTPPKPHLIPSLSYLQDPDFLLESAGAQAQVREWSPICERIAAAPRHCAAMAQEARALGAREGFVSKIYYIWKQQGWAGLIDRRKYPCPHEATLPPAFIDFLKQIYESQQRDTTGQRTVQIVMARLAAWERAPHDPSLTIPGYDEPPTRTIKGYPHGWSPRNLTRRLSNCYERALRRQGPRRASELLPFVYTTRVGLAIGQVIYFDDQWHDTHVNLTGVNSKAMRPQSFNALEALTGYMPASGLKPQIMEDGRSSSAKERSGREHAGRERSPSVPPEPPTPGTPGGRSLPAQARRRELDQLDFFWFVMLVLTTHGYNATTGTTLVFEHGTANVDKTGEFDEALQRATCGKIQIDRSGIWRAPGFRQMLFEGQPTGNFRFKAPIESWFNLFRNHCALLDAPTGRRPDLAPEENYERGRGLLGYNRAVLAMIDELPPEQFLRLRRPVVEWEDYVRSVRLIERIINRRQQHQLEGWRKLGFTGQRYRLTPSSPHWMGEADWQLIPPEQRAALEHVVRQPGCCETFLLSPEEAWQSKRHELTKLPQHLIPALAPQRAWEEIRVTDNLELTLRDPWLDSEPLRYRAKVRTPHGHEVILERGKTYRRLINIFDPSKMWIAEAEGSRRGALIGAADRVHPSCKLDSAAILTQLGEVAHIRSVESKDVAMRTESTAAARVALRTHNRAVLAETHRTSTARTRNETHLTDLANAALAATATSNHPSTAAARSLVTPTAPTTTAMLNAEC